MQQVQEPNFGVIGLEPFLVVITKASIVGSINKHDIYKIDEVFIGPPTATTATTLDSHQLGYIQMLHDFFKTPHFYFSYTYDLTNSIQRACNCNTPDYRFMWNRHALGYIDPTASNANKNIKLVPIIHGFVSCNRVAIGSRSLNWTLISRRSCLRAGTRFNRRGIDSEGNAANFVETEQIVELDEVRMSYVQIRGSIPLVWSQTTNYRYIPPVSVEHSVSNQEAKLSKHFNSLLSTYEQVSIVNLIDQKGFEGDLERKFRNAVLSTQNNKLVVYHYFDFHKECSRMRWDRLSLLMEDLRHDITSQRYSVVSNDDQLIQKQNGVFRINCIDSLDRTNVVQSMIALNVLKTQLHQYQIMSSALNLELSAPKFMFIFKNAWADNADCLSIQYAGTPALKTDFTRTGKRTQIGLLKDGVNAVTRYVHNNFLDNYRQNSIDLFLGIYQGQPTSLYKPLALPLTFIAMLIMALIFFSKSSGEL